MITKNDYKYFTKARQAAIISDYYKTHVGCVAVYQGQVIGLGCNCNKTHPTQKFYNKYRKQSDTMLPKLHAEISCVNSIKNLAINFFKGKAIHISDQEGSAIWFVKAMSFLYGCYQRFGHKGHLLHDK